MKHNIFALGLLLLSCSYLIVASSHDDQGFDVVWCEGFEPNSYYSYFIRYDDEQVRNHWWRLMTDDANKVLTERIMFIKEDNNLRLWNEQQRYLYRISKQHPNYVVIGNVDTQRNKLVEWPLLYTFLKQQENKFFLQVTN